MIEDRIEEEELEQYGFVKIKDNLAKHRRYNSYRHKCEGCGIWAKDVQGAQHMLCRKCRAHPGRVKSLEGNRLFLSWNVQ